MSPSAVFTTRCNNPHTFPALCLFLVAWCLSPALSLANDGVSDNAPAPSFYIGFGENCCGEDPHPVHGIATADGGYAVVGKSMDTSGNQDGFILKFNGDSLSGTSFMEAEDFSNYGWSQTIGSNGNMDGFNNVVSTSSALFASGFRYANGSTIDRYLVKYDLTTGSKIWEATLADPNSARDGAYESMLITADGGMVLTGVMNAEPGSLEGFKSYGNPSGGSAFIEYFSADQLSSNSAPQSSAWITTLPGANSGKGVRQLSNGGYIVAALDADEGAGHVFQISASGDVQWSNQYPEHGEITDVAILTENGSAQGIVLVGHYHPEQGGIDGSITRLSLTGDVVWHKAVGNPVGGIGAFAGLGAGNPTLIYDECWGVQGTQDGGMVVACGTGIEGCGEYSTGSAIHTECMQDPRRTWRALLVKLDKNGNEVWHRVDSFLEPGETEAPDTASEYVSLKADGSVVSIVDQGFGIGVMVLEAQSGNAPGDTSDTGGNGDTGGDGGDTGDDSNETGDEEGTGSESGNESDNDNEETIPEDTDGDKDDTVDSTDTGLESEDESSGCSATSQPTHGYSISWMLLTFLATGLYRRRLV